VSNKTALLPIIIFVLLSGCASTPRIPAIDENEAFKYERQHLVEYENLKANYIDQSAVKWIQAANKKTPCKVYVGISKTEDRTLDENYKIYWDGGCKNGYANGLGREFERGTVLNMEALAIYQGAQQEPQYYINKYNLDNKIQEGDLKNHYFVETTINDDNFNFEIDYKYGYFGSTKDPALITRSSPFSDTVAYMKHYPNFHYQLIDQSNDEFSDEKYIFKLLDKNMVTNGYEFVTPKYGSVRAGEVINNTFIRHVQLPQSYFNNVNTMYAEIIDAGQKAITAQKQALKVKKQYMSKICKDSVSVDFIDNEEYKKICNEKEYYENVKKKMDAKIAQINQLKQQKRGQLNQQKLINAQVSQANAAARSAAAAEQANTIQSWQNINNNLQVQQLNNNLMFMRMGY